MELCCPDEEVQKLVLADIPPFQPELFDFILMGLNIGMLYTRTKVM